MNLLYRYNNEQVKFEVDEDFWHISSELLDILDWIEITQENIDWDNIVLIKYEDNILWYIRYEIDLSWKEAKIKDFVTVNFNTWNKTADDNYLEYAKTLISEHLIWIQNYEWLWKNLLLNIISILRRKWVKKITLNPFGSSQDFYYKFGNLARKSQLIKFAFYSRGTKEFTYIL